jgi:hypothetical protein
MDKEFVPYEQALALKELGFNEPCFACYDELKENKLSLSTIYSFAPKNATNSNFKFNTYAPLFQQVFKWFEELGLFTTINCTNTKSKSAWEYEISSQNDRIAKHFEEPCSRFEIELMAIIRLISIQEEVLKL